MEEKQYSGLLTLGPASNELQGRASKHLCDTKSSTKWNITISKFLVIVKIVCSLLGMSAIAETSNTNAKSTALQRISSELMLFVCIVWLTTALFAIQQNITTDFGIKQLAKPYRCMLAQTFANSGSTIERNVPLCFYSSNCVNGSESEHEYESICFALCDFVYFEVVSENADTNIKTAFGLSICIVNRFSYRQKWNPAHKYYTIATSEEVLVYCFHTSFQFQADVKSVLVINTELRSKTYSSIDTYAVEDMINKTKCSSNYFDSQNDVRFNSGHNICTVDNSTVHSFSTSVSKEILPALLPRVQTYRPETLTSTLSKINIGITLCNWPENKCILNSVLAHKNATMLCLSSTQANELIVWVKTSDENETMTVNSVDLIGNVPVGQNMQPNIPTIQNEANDVPTPDVQCHKSDLQDLIHNSKRLYCVTSIPCKSIRVGGIKGQNDELIKLSAFSQLPGQNSTLQIEHDKKQVEHQGDSKENATWKIVLKDISSVSISAPRICIIAPVTRNELCGGAPQADVLRKLYDVVEKTLKSEPVPAQESMVFELLRLCTFKTFPKDEKPDVSAFAAAGFYYASKHDEVICYSCYKRISNWNKSDDPSAVHGMISPECKFITSNSEVNVSKAVTESVQSDILAKLQGTKRLSNTTNSNNTRLNMPMILTNVIDGKRSIWTGTNNESRVAVQMNTSQKTHSNHAPSTDSLPPTSRPLNTTAERFQSMIPQMFSADTASSKTSRFQTGKFVSSVNFMIPDSNTKAVQPVDDAIEPGITIDDYIDEYNSGYNGGNKSISKPSTQTTDTGLNGIVESLITSEASIIVQGMGYSSSLLKQALSRLVKKGKTKLGPQDIMQEIFLIEDE